MYCRGKNLLFQWAVKENGADTQKWMCAIGIQPISPSKLPVRKPAGSPPVKIGLTGKP